MDHFSKAIENAERQGHSVKDWVRPGPSRTGAKAGGAAQLQLASRSVTFDHDHLRAHRILIGLGNDEPAIADMYRLLRTQLLQKMRAQGWTRLAVTSAHPKAGKTMNSINLAISIARDGNQRVVLMDVDLRKPSIAEELGLEVSLGLIDYLSGDAEMSDVAVISEDIPNLTIIPGRRLSSGEISPERLSSGRMLEFLNMISSGGEPTIVLADLPPLLVGDDVILLGENMDCVLLVVEEGVTEIEELKKAGEMLQPFNLIGSVLNKSAEKPKEFSGYYHTGSRSDRSS
jgi:Mrp family chromosome partitioning ATPase